MSDTQDSATIWHSSTKTQWAYWPVLLGTALFASIVPWYFGIVDGDLRPALRVLLAGGTIAAILTETRSDTTRWTLRAAPYLLGVLLLDVLWYELGTFEVTSFLLLFAVPVFSAALISFGWMEYFVATVAVVATAATATVSSTALRWYLGQTIGYPDWLNAWAINASETLSSQTPLNGHEQLVSLGNFAVTLLGVALLGGTASRAIGHAEQRLRASTRSLEESEAFASMLLESNTVAEALVSPASGRIVSANDNFKELAGSACIDRSILDVLGPVYPETFEQLLTTKDGDRANQQICRPNDVYRVLDVDVRPFERETERFLRLTVRETSGADLVAAALDQIDLALAIVGPGQRIVFGSEPFAAIFPTARPGAGAASALDNQYGLPAGWWDIAPKRRARVRFERTGIPFTAHLTLSGRLAESSLTIVSVQRDSDV